MELTLTEFAPVPKQQQREILDDLTRLVSFRTVSEPASTASDTRTHRKAMHRAIDHMSSVADELGSLPLQVRDEYDSCPYLILGTSDTTEPDVALAVHLDVLPAVRDQFRMKTVGDRLYGRGTADNKGLAAVARQVVRQAATSPDRYKTLAVVATCDEEIGGRSTRHILEGLGLRPGVVLLPDGGKDWQLAYQAKGGVQLKVASAGINAHGARPAEGRNAIDQLVRFYNALGALTKVEDVDDWNGTTVVATGITGGEGWNQVPQTGALGFDCRYPSLADRDRVLGVFQTAAAELNDQAAGSIDVSIVHEMFPFSVDPHLPTVARFVRIVENVTGEKVTLTRDFGVSDARHYLQFAGAPSIVTMPHAGGIHGPDEWVDKQGLFQYYQAVMQFLSR